MKGDFSRKIKSKTGSQKKVYMQQGRLQLDSDWNEWVEISSNIQQSLTKDIIGEQGAPSQAQGFRIDCDGSELQISEGQYYIDGVSAENSSASTIETQVDLPGYASPTTPGFYLAYLDLWERELNWVFDESLIERALGGIDTTVRSSLVSQVRLLHLNEKVDTKYQEQLSVDVLEIDGIRHEKIKLNETIHEKISVEFKKWHTLNTVAKSGKMGVSLAHYGPPLNNWLYCVQVQGSGESYGRATHKGYTVKKASESQITLSEWMDKSAWEIGNIIECFEPKKGLGTLVRICEIDWDTHTLSVDIINDVALDVSSNNLRIRHIASIKYSHENGSVITRGLSASENTLRVDPDAHANREFKIGDCIEILDERRLLNQVPGVMVKIHNILEDELIIDRDLSALSRPVDTPYLIRRWDTLPEPVCSESPIELEQGISFDFNDPYYRRQAAWHFETRGNRRLVWPQSKSGLVYESPDAQLHKRAKLALLYFDGKKWERVHRWQRPFLSLSQVSERLPESFEELGQLDQNIQSLRDEIQALKKEIASIKEGVPQNTQLISMSGTIPDGYSATGAMVKGSSRMLLPELPRPRRGFSSVSTHTHIYIIGGDDFAGNMIDEVDAYNLYTGEWSILTTVPTSRRYCGAIIHKEHLYVLGGQNPSDGTLDTVDAFHLRNGKWTKKKPMRYARCLFGTAILDGQIAVIGGAIAETHHKLEEPMFELVDQLIHHGGTFELFNPQKNHWETRESLPENRFGAAVSSYNNRLYVMGGSNGSELFESVLEYQSELDAWKYCQPLPQQRAGLHAALVDGKIRVAGGINSDGSLNPEMDEFDPFQNHWSRCADTVLPGLLIGDMLSTDRHGILLLGGVFEDGLPSQIVEQLNWQQQYPIIEKSS